MKATIQKLPDEAIILVKYEEIDIETVKQVFTKSVEMAKDIPGRVVRISDFTHADGTVEDLKNIVSMVRGGASGSTADPKFYVIFVGRADVTWFYETLLAANGDDGGSQDTIPFFSTVDEALVFARKKLAKQ